MRTDGPDRAVSADQATAELALARTQIGSHLRRAEGSPVLPIAYGFEKSGRQKLSRGYRASVEPQHG
jgi:hypothetical protein